ncbi:hypothetical protein BDR26DRAFT_868891 [Obelidium mucronatum]|nr:hypothetical protein BDR26DRAFT_868891 [Obelidium mucronatum]
MLGPGGRSILEDSPEPKTQAAAFAGSNYADSAGGSLLLGAGFSQTQRLIHPYSQPPIPSEFKNSASVSSRMHFFKVTDSSEASSARIHTNNNPPSIASSSSSSKGIGNNRHICTWDGCGKAFKTHWHLLSHSNSHTNVKLFNCGVCELSFARKHDLSRHERSVHAVKAGAHVFACQVCGKGFGRVDSMKRHVKICKL